VAVLEDWLAHCWLAYHAMIIAHGGLEVCDGAHSWFVMKKVRGQIAESGMFAARRETERRCRDRHHGCNVVVTSTLPTADQTEPGGRASLAQRFQRWVGNAL